MDRSTIDEAGGCRVRLDSQVLQFSRDGAFLACCDADGVTIAGDPTVRIEHAGVSAIATFQDQVWALDSRRTQLQRFHRDGHALGSPHAVAPAPCTHWLVSPYGPPAVLAEGNGRHAIIEQADTLVEIAVPWRGVAIPAGGRRHILCQDGVIRFGAGIIQRLASGVSAVGGAMMLDMSKLLLIVASRGAERGAIVFSARTGQAEWQFSLLDGASRVAAQRGLLVVNSSERRFVIVDVRSRRMREPVQAPVDVDDFAIDPNAKQIAIRSGECVRVYPLDNLTSSTKPLFEFRADMPRSLKTAAQPTDAIASDIADTGSRTECIDVPVHIATADADQFRTLRLTPLSVEVAPERHVTRMPLAVGAVFSDAGIAIKLPQERTPSTISGVNTELLASTSVSIVQPTTMRDVDSTPRANTMFEPRSFRGVGELGRAHLVTPTETPSSTSASDASDASDAAKSRRMERPVEAPVIDMLKVRGFGAAPKPAKVTRHEAARLLAGELRWVRLRALLAVARGWDTGRIAYANESRHPQEAEVMAILGLNSAGNAREHVQAAESELAEQEQAMADNASVGSEATPLGALVSEFRLSALATKILLVVAAPAIQGELARLYAILAGDPARARVDELLVEQVLAESDEQRSDISHELSPGGTLCRYGLIHVGGERPRPHALLSVDPVVVARLRAEPINFGRGSATSVRSADRALHELLVPSEVLLEASRYLARSATDEHQPRIALRGPAGCGRRTLLAAIVHKAGRDVGLVDLKRLPRQPDVFATALRIELSRSQLRGLVPCLLRLDEVTAGDEDPLRGVVQDVITAHPGPVAIHLPARAKVPLEPGYLLLDLQPPTETQRLHVWREALHEYGLSLANPELLAARYRVGPGTIRSTVRTVAESRFQQGRLAGDLVADIETCLRQTREIKLGDQARRVERLAEWSSLVLPDDTMSSLRELVGRARHRRTVFDDWGMDRVISTARGLTALFEGPPGTGKTMVAGAIARELGLDLYQVDLSKIMSKWIGETEKNLGTMFDAAEDGQVILLLDEADSLFGKRGEAKSSNDRFANLQVNYLLQRLDSFEGFAILTTNFGTAIDPAFKRRLSFRLTFPFPDHEARVQLWRVHLPPTIPVAGALDLDALAHKYELSGGYIRNACLRAAFLAAEDGRPLTQAHLELAVQLEYAEVGKLSRSGRME